MSSCTRRHRSCVFWILLTAVTATVMGCSNAPLVVDEPKVGDNDEQQATCKVAKDPLNPMIIEWPGTSKVDFDVRSQAGLVAVSYAGCMLKVLPRCNIGGKYALKTVTPARDRFEMSTATDLYARLPLGAAGLKAELSQGAKLELEYVAVGQRIAEVPPGTDRAGECDGATHYVATVTVGAYSLDARASGSAGAGVDIAGAGVGAKRSEGVKRVRGSGDVDACTAKPDVPGCGAVIQLGLAELPTIATAPASSVGGVSCPSDMASIPGGTFQRSASPYFPARSGAASVQPYCLDLTEVTVQAYSDCVKRGACSADNHHSAAEPVEALGDCNWGLAGRENHPMNCVTWGGAATFCNTQGKRLPNEDEWEWAARGGEESREFPWGDAGPEFQLCWSGVVRHQGTCPVGSFPEGRGRFGNLDLAGGVMEWTSTVDTTDASKRIVRGGGFWHTEPLAMRATWGVHFDPMKVNGSLGFRCAK